MTRRPGEPPNKPAKRGMPELSREASRRVLDQTAQYLKMPEVQRANALHKASKKKPITEKVQ